MHACVHEYIYLSLHIVFTFYLYMLFIFKICLVCNQYVCLKRLSHFSVPNSKFTLPIILAMYDGIDNPFFFPGFSRLGIRYKRDR